MSGNCAARSDNQGYVKGGNVRTQNTCVRKLDSGIVTANPDGLVFDFVVQRDDRRF
jgi:hypothetical protein